jgi:hypothetical protein
MTRSQKRNQRRRARQAAQLAEARDLVRGMLEAIAEARWGDPVFDAAFEMMVRWEHEESACSGS